MMCIGRVKTEIGFSNRTTGKSTYCIGLHRRASDEEQDDDKAAGASGVNSEEEEYPIEEEE
jgi:hypothetical protein